MSNNIDYERLSNITVKSQEELDMIPLDFKGRIYVEFGDCWSPAIIRNKYYYRVVAWENSSVIARGNSSVEARGNSSVIARGNSSVEARGNSSVEAWENSSVIAWENSSVIARENSSVVAWENSSVIARENSSVVAWENSSVIARGNSSVEAWENSSVEAWENSSVIARENSSVVAWENSSVEGNGNSQIVNRLIGGRIEVSGNARIVYMPNTIEDYCNFYNIKHNKKTGKFYKCVHKKDGRYFSDYTISFEYIVGKKAVPDSFNDDIYEDCGHGIHVTHLCGVLDYGGNWGDLAILEVEADLKDIVIPRYSNGKIRCREVKVLREVPLEECGVYGKILAKRFLK